MRNLQKEIDDKIVQIKIKHAELTKLVYASNEQNFASASIKNLQAELYQLWDEVRMLREEN